MLGVKMTALFEGRLQDVDYLVEQKKLTLQKNPGRDQPMTQTLLHYSMLWSDYDLIDQVNDDAEE